MELFRAGDQTDSSGNTKKWTTGDLDKIVAKFKEGKTDIPAVVGHPKDNAPAFGWFKEVFRKGDVLMGKMAEITKEFGEALKNKNFKNRSIALRGDFSLRHVGFLGGVAPAVKHLKPFNFNEADEFAEFQADFTEDDFDEFAEFDVVFRMKDIGRMFQRLRDWVISEKGLDVADQVVNQFDIDHLKTMRVTEPKPAMTSDFNQGDNPETGGSEMEYQELYEAEKTKAEGLATELDTVKGERDSFKEKAESAEGKVSELETTISDMETEKKDGEYNAFAEGLIKDGKLDPAQKENTVAMLRSLDGQEEQEFSEGDQKVKKSPVDVYKAQLEAGSASVKTGGEYSEGAAADRNSEADEKIAALEKDGMSFNEATKKVMKDHPELFEVKA